MTIDNGNGSTADEVSRCQSPAFRSIFQIRLEPPSFFLAQNFVSHLGFIEPIYRRLGGFRIGFEAAGFRSDLLCINSPPEHIEHSTCCFYHWAHYSMEDSVVCDGETICARSGSRLVQEHFDHTGVEAAGLCLPMHVLAGQYALRQRSTAVSIITKRGISVVSPEMPSKAFRETDYRTDEDVLDNGSPRTETLNFLVARNAGALARVERIDGPLQLQPV